jgi:hypothetical protein
MADPGSGLGVGAGVNCIESGPSPYQHLFLDAASPGRRPDPVDAGIHEGLICEPQLIIAEGVVSRLALARRSRGCGTAGQAASTDAVRARPWRQPFRVAGGTDV